MPDPTDQPPVDPDAPIAVQEKQLATAEAAQQQTRTTPLSWLLVHQSGVVITVALIAALVIGAILIRIQGFNPTYAYKELFLNALGTADGIQQTLRKATPLILAGLAVAIPLRVGLFNIGGQGQLLVAAAFAAWVGFAFPSILGVSWLVSVLVGMAAGALWAAIAGLLKTWRGVHEVISTIMLNSIAAGLVDWLVNGGPAQESNTSGIQQTPEIAQGAVLGQVSVVPLGFLLALVVAGGIAWMFRRSTFGFKLDTVGKNPNAARYGGVNINLMIVLSMVIAGALAGLAGALEVTGVNHRFETALGGTIGFDGITIALLARSKPLATIPAALLVAAMRAGAPGLQFATQTGSSAGIAPEIVDLLLAITLLLVSLPAISAWLFGNRWVLGRTKEVAA